MVMALKRDQILSVLDIQTTLVEVPEWGGSVYVRGMTGEERDKFEASIVETHGKKQRMNMNNIRAKLASLTVCDEDGERLFSEKDAAALGKKSAAALQRIFEVARHLSAIGDDDIEELTEGLEDDENPFGSSPSD